MWFSLPWRVIRKSNWLENNQFIIWMNKYRPPWFLMYWARVHPSLTFHVVSLQQQHNLSAARKWRSPDRIAAAVEALLVSSRGSTALTAGGDSDRLHRSLSQLLITRATLIYAWRDGAIRRASEWWRSRQTTWNVQRHESAVDKRRGPQPWIWDSGGERGLECYWKRLLYVSRHVCVKVVNFTGKAGAQLAAKCLFDVRETGWSHCHRCLWSHWGGFK